jgi:hypothetical protein
MDYLFVPGNGRDEGLGRRVLSRRPNTMPIQLRGRNNNLAGLLARLTALAPTAGNPNPRPIGDLLFVAHGLETGEYFIPLARGIPSPADFERAERANAADRIRLTAALLTPAGGGPPVTITVRLRGCNFGVARPFVEKLQEAMLPAGGTLEVTAPIHFDEFHDIHGGTLEYLGHKFTVRADQQFKQPNGRDDNRPALLAAFDNQHFTYLNGTAIPAGSWDGWIPQGIHPPPRNWKQLFNMTVGLNPAVGAQNTATIHREYRYEARRFSWNWTVPNAAGHAQGGPRVPTPVELDILRNTLPIGAVPPSGLNLYDPSYPWPLYERFGFTDIDDFADNLPWRVRLVGRNFRFRAVRHEYTVLLPITDPPAAAAPPAPPPPPVLQLYNFFPTRAAPPLALNLPETNTSLFLNL